MKKTLFGLMTIVMMAVMCVGLSACGSDDGDSDSSGMTGVWKRVYKKTTYYEKNSSGEWIQSGTPEEKSYEGTESDGIMFMPDNKCVEVDVEADGSYRADDEILKYKIENGKLYILELDHPEDGWEVAGTISISGNQFELTLEDVYSNTKRVKFKRYRKIG